MIKTPRLNSRRRAFTLIELLTVIAIIGILAAIIIPTVGKVRETAKRTADANSLREIGKSGAIFASDNRDKLPQRLEPATGVSYATPVAGVENISTGGVSLFAAGLAKSGGLNDAKIWVSGADQTGVETNAGSTVLNALKTDLEAAGTPTFTALSLGFGVVSGLTMTDPSTTPFAYTRGLFGQADGTWSATTGVYKAEGGHIVFLGGNVQFYRNLGPAEGTGELINSNGSRTRTISNTIIASRTNVKFVEEGVNGTTINVAAASGG